MSPHKNDIWIYSKHLKHDLDYMVIFETLRSLKTHKQSIDEGITFLCQHYEQNKKG